MNELIFVEGVVGAGKTDFLELLMEMGYYPISNAVSDNDDILNKFYYNKSGYSFMLQATLLARRARALKQSQDGKFATDKSIYGVNIFSIMMNNGHEMTDDEFELYSELFDVIDYLIPKPTLLVFLKIDTDNAIKNIENRGRQYEQEVDRDYWERLNHEYNIFIENYSASEKVIIDVNNLDIKYNINDRKKAKKLIADAIEKSKGVDKDE